MSNGPAQPPLFHRMRYRNKRPNAGWIRIVACEGHPEEVKTGQLPAVPSPPPGPPPNEYEESQSCAAPHTMVAVSLKATCHWDDGHELTAVKEGAFPCPIPMIEVVGDQDDLDILTP